MNDRECQFLTFLFMEWPRLPGTDGETIRELNEIQEDPFEYNNPVASGAHQSVVTRLSRHLKMGWRSALP